MAEIINSVLLFNIRIIIGPFALRFPCTAVTVTVSSPASNVWSINAMGAAFKFWRAQPLAPW